jgi:indolepyruvate ferredoxin oxidoreductase alpha subunit
MHKEFLMGNAAIALGALAAGVNVVCGYPGTPSTEALETVAKHNREGRVYVEWSTNEKAALELGAGAALSGARVLVTMKQVGLNVASDPLMSLAYIGVKGGMVIMVADDPGPISSQTEQDTRSFAAFSKLPCFDPSSVQEAYDQMREAFAFSEKYRTPVLLRPTTRVCHGYASIDVRDEGEYERHRAEGFEKDSSRWVIFPRLSFAAHSSIEARNAELREKLSDHWTNKIIPTSNVHSRRGLATHGISYTYVMEALQGRPAPRVLKVGTPFPFPERTAVDFLSGLDEVLCVEELDPVIERELTYICGKYRLPVAILGKLTGNIAASGENTPDSVALALSAFLASDPGENTPDSTPPAIAASLGESSPPAASLETPLPIAPSLGQSTPPATALETPPALPLRPPVLCAGCPHRASFYAVKVAMRGKKAVFCGDIGCYTLGNAQPLDMVDTCLCMGAGVNIAQGIGRIEPDTTCFAFVGDSTFFASTMTGVVNAVYNKAKLTLVVLDNATTAMTGNQPHPGTGRTMMGASGTGVSIENTLLGMGVETVEVCDPLNTKQAVAAVKRVAAADGVGAIVFRSPCAQMIKPSPALHIDDERCINCRRCVKELGCPGLVSREGRVAIDESLCTGCGLCAGVCPVNAIGGGANE